MIEDENNIDVGEWAWIRRIHDWEGDGVEKCHLILILRDPDCKIMSTLWRRFGDDVPHGHDIDKVGNVTPSVYHKWPYGDPPIEHCGFHTQPTKLLDFVDLR